MVDSTLVLAIGASVIVGLAGIGIAILASSTSGEKATEEPYMGDSEYYTRGGKSRKRSRKHKKKTLRKNK